MFASFHKIFQVRESKQTLEQSGTLFLAYKALVRHPAEYFVINKERLLVNDPKFVMEEESDLDQSERIIKSLYNMVTHDEQCSTEDRVKTAIRSAVLVNCMKTSGYLCLEKQPDQQDFFMQLLYHMQMAMAHRSGNEYNGFLFHHLQNVSNMEKLKANFCLLE